MDWGNPCSLGTYISIGSGQKIEKKIAKNTHRILGGGEE